MFPWEKLLFALAVSSSASSAPLPPLPHGPSALPVPACLRLHPDGELMCQRSRICTYPMLQGVGWGMSESHCSACRPPGPWAGTSPEVLVRSCCGFADTLVSQENLVPDPLSDCTRLLRWGARGAASMPPGERQGKVPHRWSTICVFLEVKTAWSGMKAVVPASVYVGARCVSHTLIGIGSVGESPVHAFPPPGHPHVG